MDSVLRKKCLKVENIDAALVALADNMIETMYSASGSGLAANQVGVSSDLFVIDVGIEKEEHDPVIIINPVITTSEDEIIAEEGCLSIPEVFDECSRCMLHLLSNITINRRFLYFLSFCLSCSAWISHFEILKNS